MSTDDIDEMTDRLLASSLHRDTLLNPHHREVSIGLASGCSLKTMVQLFEGEFVRFAAVPQLVDGRLVMEGNLLGGVTMKEGAGILIRWEQPLTGSSKSLLWQTGCRYEPMPVLELVPVGTSDRLEPNRIVEREWIRCQSPREADPSLRFPEDMEQILQHRAGPGFELQTRTVNVMVAAADVWHEEPDLFRIEADLSQVIDIMGPGIYTVELQGDLSGVAIPLSLYSLFVSAGIDAGSHPPSDRDGLFVHAGALADPADGSELPAKVVVAVSGAAGPSAEDAVSVMFDHGRHPSPFPPVRMSSGTGCLGWGTAFPCCRDA